MSTPIDTSLDALLGPVDTGPKRHWIHIAFRRSAVTLCGETTSPEWAPLLSLAGSRCPDCLRIARQKGYL